MVSSILTIIVIFNPNSTGGATEDAQKLKSALKNKNFKANVILKETEYAGHAEEIGSEYAKKDEPVLLVSASGDGGYNELINGVLKHDTKNVSVAVLPSGNANDHHTAMSSNNLVERIVDNNISYIDVINVKGKKNGNEWSRYAHSYVGIGMTAYIGEKLTKAQLNPLNEKWLLMKYFVRFKYVKVKINNNSYHTYTNIIVANINRMSKVIRLDQDSKVDDGILELYATRVYSFTKLLFILFKAGAYGLEPVDRVKRTSITTTKPLKIQCDGEVFELDTGITSISARVKKLRVII